MFHQEASVETIKLIYLNQYLKNYRLKQDREEFL